MISDPFSMTPFFPEKGENEISALLLELKEEAGRLLSAVHPVTARSIEPLVVNMNSYYSNLIEGNFTHPLNIERALKKDYSTDKKKKTLQLESEAHVLVNREMRLRLEREADLDICSVDFIRWLHAAFYNHLPEELRIVYTHDGEQWPVRPGELRDHEVIVGGHTPPTWKSLPVFMQRFDENYDGRRIASPIRRILAIAASHHRLAWIHPFGDGNGRVSRLYSEAYLIRERLSAGGLWSISRGLAVHRKEYYAHLNNADMPRRNDYDGHGYLSDEGLRDFCLYFLRTALDQIKFMSSLLDIDNMLARIERFVALSATDGKMRPESAYLLKEVFLRGHVSKGEIMHITGRSEAVARPIMNDLLTKGLLQTDEGHRAPLRIGFPVSYAGYLFPKLYPPDIEATLMHPETL